MCIKQCSSWKTAREKTSLPGASGKCIGGGSVCEVYSETSMKPAPTVMVRMEDCFRGKRGNCLRGRRLVHSFFVLLTDSIVLWSDLNLLSLRKIFFSVETGDALEDFVLGVE